VGPSAPSRWGPTWAEFLRTQEKAILATDFFTVTLLDSSSVYVLAIIEHASQRVRILGVTAACDHLLRLDPNVTPTMYHAATFTVAERERLRTIENVVRLGRIETIGAGEIELEQGVIPTDRGQLYVDCSGGLGKAPARPIFEPGRITLQCISTVHPTFNAAVLGYLEASRGDDEVAKSRLSPTTRYPDGANDWISNMRGQLESLSLWNAQPDLARGWSRAAATSPEGCSTRRANLGWPRRSPDSLLIPNAPLRTLRSWTPSQPDGERSGRLSLTCRCIHGYPPPRQVRHQTFFW
jgi:hypothetical protein